MVELIDVDKAMTDVFIDQPSLNDEFIRQPGLMYFYTSKYAKAERNHAELKLRLEATEAKVASNVRDKAALNNEKLTADIVKERVRLDPSVIKTEQALIVAQEVQSVAKGLVEAIRQKKDMLLIKGYMTRDEMKANIAVNESLPGGRSSHKDDIVEQLKARQGNEN